MPEIVYVTLRYVFLALLYLFVGLVVWVIYRELRPQPERKRAKPDARREKTRGRASLVLKSASGRRRQGGWDLEDEVVIGRSGQCSITLNDEFVSNLHAKIYEVERRFYVEDLGSTNGTYVNGRRINYPTELRRGDLIKVGGTVMEFRR